MFVGAVVLAWNQHPLFGVLVAVVLLVLIGMALTPKKCDICRSGIKRVSYTWTIDGKKTRVCPNCSSRLDRRVSKAAVDRFLR